MNPSKSTTSARGLIAVPKHLRHHRDATAHNRRNRVVRFADAREGHATLGLSMRAHSSVAGRDDSVGTPSRSRGAAAADAGTPTTPPRASASSADDDSVSPSVPSPSSAAAGLAAHVQSLGWDEQEFSDVSVTAFGETYALHRLVLSRSPYFRALMRGPWSDAASPRLTLTFDDAHIDRRAVEASLAFLYDKLPTLDAESAPRVLAAAAFLDLEDLCRHCADFIVADVREETFVAYQRFAESRDHGEHGERVRAACWGYMCAQGSRELASRLHRLSHATLDRLLGSDELWVPNESARFALARRVFADKKVAATEPEPNAVARGVANVEDDARSVVRGIVDDLLDEMDGSTTKGRTVTTTATMLATKPTTTTRRFAEDETSRRTEASLAASTLARCVRYQHVPFEDLEEMRRELDGDERVFPDHDRDEYDDPTSSSSRSPIRAVLEGLWTHTLLRSHVAKMCEGEEEAVRRVREDGGAEDGEGTSDGARGESPREEEEVRFSSEGAEDRPRDANKVPSSPDGTELPFRFGVEIEDALGLADGQARHSGEEFFAGSLWKVSVQAFSDEDPSGRRTLGLFLHRRPARERDAAKGPAGHGKCARGAGASAASSSADGPSETNATPRRAYAFADSRETVNVRYELQVPSKHEIVRLGVVSPEVRPTRLPRAPKGWGWRTALMFDDLAAACTPSGALRVVAVVQLA